MILTVNTLSEIFKYLSLTDLLSVSQVNKKFSLSAKNQSIFKREFLKIWISNSECSKAFLIDWKYLCVKGLRIDTYWNTVPMNIIKREYIDVIHKEVRDALSTPEIIIPELRKDMLSFPTIIQDMLGNNNESICSFYPYNIKSSFKNVKIMISKDPDTIFLNFLMPIMNAIKKSISLYCKGVKSIICENEDILETYIEQWSSYSLSIKRLNMLLSPISDMINYFYSIKEPLVTDVLDFSVIKMMIDIWKTKVFNKLKIRLFYQFLKELDVTRKQSFCFYLCQRPKIFIESILDITLNQINIHFKNHSKLLLEDPYKSLHDLALFTSINYYQACDAEDADVISYIFPQVTAIELKKLSNEIIKERFNTTNDLEFLETIKKNEDFTIEFKAKHLGLTTEDIFKYSQCKNINLIDVLTHIQYYQHEHCT